MKRTLLCVLFLVAFSAVFSLAQELDTTYFVAANGQKYAVIHEKGTPAVFPAEILGNSNAVAPTPTAPTAAAPAPVSSVAPKMVYQSEAAQNIGVLPLNSAIADSIRFYEEKADVDFKNGNGKRRVGNGLLTTGIVFIPVGLLMMLAGASDMESCDDSYYDNDCDDNDGGVILFIAGYGMALASIPLIGTGIALKAVGSHKLRRAERHRARADYFKTQGNMVKLHVTPVINPMMGSFGSRLLLEF